MALIICPDCNREISNQADKCIHCGYPIKQKLYEEYINDLKEHEQNHQVPCSKCREWNEVGDTLCKRCGNVITDTDYEKFNQVLHPNLPQKYKTLPVLNLIISILSFILAAFILYESCILFIVYAINGISDNTGFVGLFLASCLISSGIIAIVCGEKENQRHILVAVIYALGGLIGFCSNTKMYKEFFIWTGFCILFSFIYFIKSVLKSKKNRTTTNKLHDIRNQDEK